MTLLVRMVGSLDPWMQSGSDEQLAYPPLSALREFIPSHDDKGWLSLFDVDGEDDAETLAAACKLHKAEKKSGPVYFIAVEADQVRNAGIQIRQSPGRWHHPYAISQHRDILLEDVMSVVNITRIFMQGQPFTFEERTVWKSIRNEVRRDRFLWSDIAKQPNTQAAINLLKFIGEEIVVVNGVPPP